MERKQCGGCGVWKALDHYAPNSKRDDGLCKWCNGCITRGSKRKPSWPRGATGRPRVHGARIILPDELP